MSGMDEIRLLQRQLAELERKVRALDSELSKIPTRLSSGDGGSGRSIYVAANFAALNALTGLIDSDQGYTEDKHYFYHRRNGEWWISHPYFQDNSPSELGEHDGDSWYAPAADVRYKRVAGAWVQDVQFRISTGRLQYLDSPTWWDLSHYF